MISQTPLFIATNNGDIGGGEVMLLNIARAARSLGHSVTIVGPSQPAELIDAAKDEGFATVTLPATTRRDYMAQLRVWDKRQRQGLLWCNGLVPSFATSGHKNRIVHLHQIPVGKQKYLVVPAQRKALRTLVPSDFMTAHVKNSEAFPNWVSEVSSPLVRKNVGDNIRVGFLGRPSTIKGTNTLAKALKLLSVLDKKQYTLVTAGEPKFVGEDDQREVETALSSLGDSVENMGWVSPEKLMQTVDMLVVPSEVDESFGLVAAEAMSARVPLIVSDAGALPEVVGKEYPWIAPKGNTTVLAQRISDLADALIAHDENLQDTISGSYWRWQENFSPDAGKERVRRLLEFVENK